MSLGGGGQHAGELEECISLEYSQSIDKWQKIVPAILDKKSSHIKKDIPTLRSISP